MQDWSRTAEQIMLSAIESQIRSLGFISPASGSGTSTVARGVAEAFARAGHKTVLFDLTADVRSDAKLPTWLPGGAGVAGALHVEATGLAVLTADSTPATRALFNNVEHLQKVVRQDLSTYAAVVMDLPAVTEDETNRLNPLAAARVCDAVLMVCLTGHVDRSTLAEAVNALKPAGVNVAGVVLNDYYVSTLGKDIADTTDAGLGRYLPGLARRLARRASSNRFLNERFPFVP